MLEYLEDNWGCCYYYCHLEPYGYRVRALADEQNLSCGQVYSNAYQNGRPVYHRSTRVHSWDDRACALIHMPAPVVGHDGPEDGTGKGAQSQTNPIKEEEADKGADENGNRAHQSPGPLLSGPGERREELLGVKDGKLGQVVKEGKGYANHG